MKLPFNKIKNQVLFIFLLILTGTILLIGFFSVSFYRSTLTEQMIENERRFARTVKRGLSTSFEELFLKLRNLSSSPELQYSNSNTERVIESFVEHNPILINAFLYSPQGEVLIAVDRRKTEKTKALVGKNIMLPGDRLKGLQDSFKATLRVNETHVASIHQSPRHGNILVIYQPVNALDDPSRITGVLSIALHLDGTILHQNLSEFKVNDGFILLTDRNGKIIARNGPNLPKSLHKASFEKYHLPDGIMTFWDTFQNRDYLFNLVKFPYVKGLIIFASPKDNIQRKVNQLLSNLIYISLIPVLIAGFVSWILARYYLERILEIVNGLKKIAAGIFSERINETSEDELGEAARAFNEMADSLERNHLIGELWNERWNRENDS